MMAMSEKARARAQAREPEQHRGTSDRSTDRVREIGMDLSPQRRGGLDLGRDMAQHRRHAWLYDDLLA